ncbi:hypothetical protein CDL15_Pgr014065 [Punica granatum]|uniref:Uncharacterized protein n=1 Tax=Punica granatum TaxID=22663 RepID=A0A218W9R6_PUNGR|nr:hypothetical protein CDL15_Pgr014065 [Punica granatum]
MRSPNARFGPTTYINHLNPNKFCIAYPSEIKVHESQLSKTRKRRHNVFNEFTGNAEQLTLKQRSSWAMN